MNSKQRRKEKRSRKGHLGFDPQFAKKLSGLGWDRLPQSVRNAHVPYGGPENVAAMRKGLDAMHEVLAKAMRDIEAAYFAPGGSNPDGTPGNRPAGGK